MHHGNTSIHLFARLCDGDDLAATDVFRRYANRLIALASSRISDSLQRRVSPEDVVQSAYRSFFRVSAQQRYVCEQSGDMWRLLSTITINKIRRQIEYHHAGKRSLRQEVNGLGTSPNEASTWTIESIDREPTAEEAAMLVEELERYLNGLEPLHRRVLERAMEGASVEDTAREVARSERTVRRILESARESLERRVLEVQSE